MKEKEELNLQLLKEEFADLHTSTQQSEGFVDFARTKYDELTEFQYKTMVSYGVYKRQYEESISIENEKKQQKNMEYYENEMAILNEQYKEVKELLQQISAFLERLNIAHPPVDVTDSIEEDIKNLFPPYAYELLVNIEEIEYLANKTQRVELRIPVGLLNEIDKYQLINGISSRSQAIFELCRIALHK